MNYSSRKLVKIILWDSPLESSTQCEPVYSVKAEKSNKERQHVVFIESHQISKTEAHFGLQRSPSFSGHCSDSPQNRILVPFFEDDMLHLLLRSINVHWANASRSSYWHGCHRQDVRPRPQLLRLCFQQVRLRRHLRLDIRGVLGQLQAAGRLFRPLRPPSSSPP